MPATAKVGIQYTSTGQAEAIAYGRKIAQEIAKSFVGMLGNVKIDGNAFDGYIAGAQKAGRAARDTFQSTEESRRKADAALEASEKRKAEISAKYYATNKRDSANLTKQLIDDIKKMQDERANILHAMGNTVDHEAKRELNIRQRQIADELKLYKQEALERDAVSKGGAAGKTGLLGTGRQIVGAVPGLGGLANLSGGTALAGAGIAAVAAGLEKVVSIGGAFEDRLANLSAITGASAVQLDQMATGARSLALEFGGHASEQLDIYTGILSRFGPAIGQSPEAVQAMAHAIAELSAASGGELSPADSMDALTNAALQFGINLENPTEAARELTRIENVLAAGAKEGAANIKQSAESMVTAGAAFKSANVSIEEADAAIQITAEHAGKYGSEAGTPLKNIIGLLQKNSDEAKTVIRGLGLDFDELGEILTTKGLAPAMQYLRTGLDLLGSDAEKNAARLQIFGTENDSVAVALLNNSEEMGKFQGKITGTNVAYEQAQKNMATTNAELSRSVAAMEDVALTVYQDLKPALAVCTDILKIVIQVLGYLITMLSHGIRDAVKLAVTAFNDLVQRLKNTWEWITYLADIVMGAFSSAWRWVLNLLQPVINIFKDVKKWIDENVSIVGVWIDWLWKTASPIGFLIDNIGSLIGWLKDAWDWIGKVFSAADQPATEIPITVQPTVAAPKGYNLGDLTGSKTFNVVGTVEARPGGLVEKGTARTKEEQEQFEKDEKTRKGKELSELNKHNREIESAHKRSAKELAAQRKREAEQAEKDAIKIEEFQIDQLQKQGEADQQFFEDEAREQEARRAAELKEEQDFNKDWEAAQKEKSDVALAIRTRTANAIEDETERALALEQLRYEKELENTKGVAALKELAEKEHADKVADIQEKSFQDSNILFRSQMSIVAGIVSQGLNDLDALWRQSFGNQKTLLFAGLSELASIMKSALAGILKDLATKAVTFIAQNLAIAASFIAQAIAAAFAWMWSVNPVLAITVGTGIWLGIASQWAKVQDSLGLSKHEPERFAEGGVATRPIFSPMFGKAGAYAGEAGPEAIIPLDQFPGIMAAIIGKLPLQGEVGARTFEDRTFHRIINRPGIDNVGSRTFEDRTFHRTNAIHNPYLYEPNDPSGSLNLTSIWDSRLRPWERATAGNSPGIASIWDSRLRPWERAKGSTLDDVIAAINNQQILDPEKYELSQRRQANYKRGSKLM